MWKSGVAALISQNIFQVKNYFQRLKKIYKNEKVSSHGLTYNL